MKSCVALAMSCNNLLVVHNICFRATCLNAKETQQRCKDTLEDAKEKERGAALISFTSRLGTFATFATATRLATTATAAAASRRCNWDVDIHPTSSRRLLFSEVLPRLDDVALIRFPKCDNSRTSRADDGFGFTDWVQQERDSIAAWRYSVNSVHANGVIMFKARKGVQDNTGVYMDPIDGIYYKKRGNDWSSPLSKMVETGMDSTIFDAEAVVPVGFLETGSAMTVSEIGMEREALRGRFVVLTLRFGAQVTALEEAEEDEKDVEFAGIYIANMPAG